MGEEARGSISKGSFLTMIKYVPAALHEVKFCSFKTSRVPYRNCKSVNTVTAELGIIVEIPPDRVRAKLPMPMSIHLPKMME